MKITIEYESSWRNSFLEGSNDEPLPKTGRKFIGSMTNLKKSENYIQREVTHNTVMGILNRLIGDQRKLYQSRLQKDYYYRDIESRISFKDEPKVLNHEMTYIRNITGSTDQNSFTGMVKDNDPIFTSDYSTKFWGVLSLELNGLCDFILNETPVESVVTPSPLFVISTLESINKLKPVEKQGEISEAFELISKQFPKFKGVNSKGLVLPISLYCSALYLQLERLGQQYNMDTAKTKAGGIGGISNNGFTKKDFMGRYTTGEKKKIWGNPYIQETMIKGEGKTKNLMTKASGLLAINLDIEKEKARELNRMIEDAGVSSFYLGKKGLAYVSKVRV